jgi:hypothetical protein
MWIQDELRDAIRKAGIDASELPVSRVDDMFRALEQAFGSPGAGPLWERLQESTGVCDPNGWKRIPTIISGHPLMLVADSQGRCGFAFRSAGDLVRVLAESSNFEFYITDDEYRYLLAFNHHDMVIGVNVSLS